MLHMSQVSRYSRVRVSADEFGEREGDIWLKEIEKQQAPSPWNPCFNC